MTGAFCQKCVVALEGLRSGGCGVMVGSCSWDIHTASGLPGSVLEEESRADDGRIAGDTLEHEELNELGESRGESNGAGIRFTVNIPRGLVYQSLWLIIPNIS
jgi:hypothetical protein